MNKNKYMRIYDPEITDDAYAYIFSNSDHIEYLSEDGYGHIDAVEELYGTDLGGFIPAYIGDQKGDSWGMWGTVFAFTLTDFVKQKVKQNGLANSLVTSGGKIVFQNATLYNGSKAVFSCCSHEGHKSYDEEFECGLADICCSAIEKSNCYGDMLEVFKKVSGEPAEIRARERAILSNTQNYIDQAGNAQVYVKPPYECKFAEYKRIAEKYLQTEVFTLLKGAKSFADLHPNGYPQHADELEEREKFAPLPTERALLGGIDRNLFYLNYIEDKFGIAKKNEKFTPEITLVFNQQMQSEMKEKLQKLKQEESKK
ncbi:MAG: hypothetical protein LUD19_03115 [Clostridia bacterium]|nr:hypothetical protein [Clostridia bacterium]